MSLMILCLAIPCRDTFDANVGHAPSPSTYCCTLWKRGIQKEKNSRRGEWKEYKNNRRFTCQVRLPPVPTCVAVATCVVPVPPRFSPSYSAPPCSPPVSYSTGSCRQKERAKRCQRKNNKNLTIN